MRKVLVLDDEPISLEVVRGELGSRFTLIETDSYVQAIGQLYANPDLSAVVAHMNTKRGQAGAEFMVEVGRMQPRCRRILYSRWPGAEGDARVFAHDFLVFPWSGGHLRAMVRRLIGTPPPPDDPFGR